MRWGAEAQSLEAKCFPGACSQPDGVKKNPDPDFSEKASFIK